MKRRQKVSSNIRKISRVEEISDDDDENIEKMQKEVEEILSKITSKKKKNKTSNTIQALQFDVKVEVEVCDEQSSIAGQRKEHHKPNPSTSHNLTTRPNSKNQSTPEATQKGPKIIEPVTERAAQNNISDLIITTGIPLKIENLNQSQSHTVPEVSQTLSQIELETNTQTTSSRVFNKYVEYLNNKINSSISCEPSESSNPLLDQEINLDTEKVMAAMKYGNENGADNYIYTMFKNYENELDMYVTTPELGLQKALALWRDWFLQDPEKRGAPLLYKCKSCGWALWHLQPFRDHINNVHSNTTKLKFEFEALNGESYIVVQVPGIKPMPVRIIKRPCWRCGLLPDMKYKDFNTTTLSYHCICGQQFSTCYNYRLHIDMCEKRSFRLWTKARYKCHLCFLKFETSIQLNEHKIDSHKVRSDIPAPWPKTSCQFCHAPCSSGSVHNCAAKKSALPCNYCTKKFINQHLLNIHWKSSKENVKCRVCDKILYRACMEHNHLVEHADGYILLHKCTICDGSKYFYSDSGYKKHLHTTHPWRDDTAMQVPVPKKCLEDAGYSTDIHTAPTITAIKVSDGNDRNPSNDTEVVAGDIELITDEVLDASLTPVSPSRQLCSSTATVLEEPDCVPTGKSSSKRKISDKESCPKRLKTIRKVNSCDQNNGKVDDLFKSLDSQSIEEFINTEKEINEMILFKTHNNDVFTVKIENTKKDKVRIEQNKIASSKIDSNANSNKRNSPCSTKSENCDASITHENITANGRISNEKGQVSKGTMEFAVKEKGTSEINEANVNIAKNEMHDKISNKSNLVTTKNNKKVAHIDVVNVQENKMSIKIIDTKTLQNITVPEQLHSNTTNNNIDLKQNVNNKSLNVYSNKNKKNRSKLNNNNNNSAETHVQDNQELFVEMSDNCEVREKDNNDKEQINCPGPSNIRIKEEPIIGEFDKNIRIKEEILDNDTDDERLVIAEYNYSHYDDIKLEVKEEQEECFEDDMIVLDHSHVGTDNNSDAYVEGCQSTDDDEDYTSDEGRRKRRRRKRRYSTKLCKFSGNKSQLKEHKKECRRKHYPTKFSADMNDIYKCTICSKEFSTLKYYLMHLTAHQYKAYQCPECSFIYPTWTKLIFHITNHINKLYLPIRGISSVTAGLISLQCTICSVEVERKELFSHWEQHLTARTDERDADLPDKNFAPESPILREVIDLILDNKYQDEKGKLHRCIICQRDFTRRNERKRHYIEHLLDDAYTHVNNAMGLRCQICGEVTSKAADFRVHIRSHTSMPVYRCELCSKTFSDSSNFAKHRKVHNLCSYVCDLCNKKFNLKVSIINHMKLHNTQKPIHCEKEGCNKIFYTPGSYNKHVKASHLQATFACPICKMTFSSLKHTWDHKWQVHKIRKIIADCPVCDKKFRKYIDVKTHIRLMHSTPHHLMNLKKVKNLSPDEKMDNVAHLADNVEKSMENEANEIEIYCVSPSAKGAHRLEDVIIHEPEQEDDLIEISL